MEEKKFPFYSFENKGQRYYIYRAGAPAKNLQGEGLVNHYRTKMGLKNNAPVNIESLKKFMGSRYKDLRLLTNDIRGEMKLADKKKKDSLAKKDDDTMKGYVGKVLTDRYNKKDKKK